MKRKGVFFAIKDPRIYGKPFLCPADHRAHAMLDEMEDHKKVLVWVHTARYPEHHRFAFAVLQRIADSIGRPVEVVLLYLKYETGRFDWLKLPDGRVVENPHSIAFESMDQKDFQRFWDDALTVVREKLLPHMSEADFNEIRDMIAGKVDA